MVAIAGLGGLLCFIAVIWMVVIAVQNGDILWAIGSFFCFIVFLIYGIQKFEQAKIPLGLFGAGFVLSLIGNVLAAMQAG
jgi:hypothetical protein